MAPDRRAPPSARPWPLLLRTPVTVPFPPSAPTATPGAFTQQPEPAAPVHVPVSWLLDRGSAPVQTRTLLDVVCVKGQAAADAAIIALAHPAALRLAVQQRPDGTWGGRMLAVPSEGEPGVGTILAVRRLVESGWSADSPPLWAARKVLFRLLAEDADPAYLFELRDPAMDDAHVRRGRLLLREAAGAALAQLGYEGDPRVRGAAARILDRMVAFVRSPDARSEDRPSILPAEATPPSAHALTMLAFMPFFRSEHSGDFDRIINFLVQAPPAGTPRQRISGKAVDQPHLVLGDPLAGAEPTGRDLPRVLVWLEILARLGGLRRPGPWTSLLDALLDARDADGVLRAPRGVEGARGMRDPLIWPTFPLAPGAGTDALSAELTFRLALIARIAGRTLVLG